MEQSILIFWIAVYALVWFLRRNPHNVVSRAAFTWIGPRPVVGETLASFQLRWASYSFGRLCQFAVALSALLVLASYFSAVSEHTWFRVLLFALPFGIGVAVLATLGFVLKAVKAQWVGPNPTCLESPGIKNAA